MENEKGLTPVGVGAVVGRCKNCAQRDKTGHCTSEKLAEDWGQSNDEKNVVLF